MAAGGEPVRIDGQIRIQKRGNPSFGDEQLHGEDPDFLFFEADSRREMVKYAILRTIPYSYSDLKFAVHGDRSSPLEQIQTII